MYLNSQSFNLHFTNLFIGLFLGHPFLRPYSLSFHKLGYNHLRLEPKFKYLNDNQSKEINPDAILANTENIILIEWTSEQAISDRKKTQITKYIHPKTFSSVKQKLNGIDNSDSNIKLWIVIRPEANKDYKNFIGQTHGNSTFLSLFYHNEEGFILDYSIGEFYDKNFNKIFDKQMIFNRIPEGYISISLDDFSSVKFKDGIIQEIVSLMLKEKSKFTIDDIYTGMFPIWNYFSEEKRRQVEQQVKNHIRSLRDSYNIQDWFVYSSPNSIEIYESFDSMKFKGFLKKLKENDN